MLSQVKKHRQIREIITNENRQVLKLTCFDSRKNCMIDLNLLHFIISV